METGAAAGVYSDAVSLWRMHKIWDESTGKNDSETTAGVQKRNSSQWTFKIREDKIQAVLELSVSLWMAEKKKTGIT